MSQKNVEIVRRALAALNEAYKTGNLLPVAEEFCDPEIIFNNEALTTGYPEIGEWHGYEGMLQFAVGQAEAFEQMWIKPAEFIDAGDEKVLVALRLGGKARHTGIEVELSVLYVVTLRDGKVLCIGVFSERERALEAAGLSE